MNKTSPLDAQALKQATQRMLADLVESHQNPHGATPTVRMSHCSVAYGKAWGLLLASGYTDDDAVCLLNEIVEKQNVTDAAC